VAARTGAPPATIDRGRPFAELGLDSMLAVELALELGRHVGAPVAETLLWEHPTIAELTQHFEGDTTPTTPSPDTTSHGSLEALRNLTRDDSR
jgi:acyl carrier protein